MPDITTGLIGHWKLDEGAGTTANDSSGNGNHGTIVGGPSWETGSIGGALLFNDGASGHYVTAPLDYSSLPMTLACRVFIPGTWNAFWAGILFSRGPASGINFRGSEDLNLGYTWNNEENTWSWDSGIYLPASTWVTLALVIESDKATIYAYSSVEQVSAVNSVAHSASTFDHIRFANDSMDGGRSLWGLMDEVRAYSRALTEEDVEALYSGESPSSDADAHASGVGASAFGGQSLASSLIAAAGQGSVSFVGEAQQPATPSTNRWISGWAFSRRNAGSSLALLNPRTVGIDTDATEQTVIRAFFFPAPAGEVNATVSAGGAAEASFGAASFADGRALAAGASVANFSVSLLAGGAVSVSGQASAGFVGQSDNLVDTALFVLGQGAASVSGASLVSAAALAAGSSSAQFASGSLASAVAAAFGQSAAGFSGNSTSASGLSVVSGATASIRSSSLADGASASFGASTAQLSGSALAGGAVLVEGNTLVQPVGDIASESAVFSAFGTASMIMHSDNDDAAAGGGGGALAALSRRRILQQRQAAA